MKFKRANKKFEPVTLTFETRKEWEKFKDLMDSAYWNDDDFGDLVSLIQEFENEG